MKNLFKKSLLLAIIFALFIDILVTFCPFNICGILGILGGTESLFYYPAYVITYFFGGSIFGLSWSLNNIYTNLFFLLIEFIYLFIIIFFSGLLFIGVKKIILFFINKK